MKLGDTFDVTVSGQVVAQAKVTEMGDGTATLLIPGTIAVMGVRTELAPPPPVEQETSHVLLGAEETIVPEAQTPVVEQPTESTDNGEQVSSS